jgi:hypothetical protein
VDERAITQAFVESGECKVAADFSCESNAVTGRQSIAVFVAIKDN